jgi:hypothetical protein
MKHVFKVIKQSIKSLLKKVNNPHKPLILNLYLIIQNIHIMMTQGII